MTFTRANILKFESITIKDEEMDKGALPEDKVHLATLGFFVFYEALVMLAHYFFADFNVLQLVTLSIMALILARQTALDFAYHILLEIYNLPFMIGGLFIPAMMFDNGTITQSLIGAFGLFGFFIAFTAIASWLKGQLAGIGGGDVLFAFAIGGFLQGFLIFISMFVSSVLSLIITCFYKDKRNVPFGPGLLISFWLCLLFGPQILQFINYIL